MNEENKNGKDIEIKLTEEEFISDSVEVSQQFSAELINQFLDNGIVSV
ncbi:MAG: hypothetical protein BTN85_0999 [Candidatus Methanohalarchaeum thermophilum]|uniref:Uncharacterized protein n=1 Tax=Methanohalarchaeum thermophilum TaxID=1903181 RepID=A0A1Q6DVZ0_METT1|nr:MAG: hypothetical protein BTN85_0999 [Candidatus Methanohalarchaeum thermophilum]